MNTEKTITYPPKQVAKPKVKEKYIAAIFASAIVLAGVYQMSVTPPQQVAEASEPDFITAEDVARCSQECTIPEFREMSDKLKQQQQQMEAIKAQQQLTIESIQ